MSDTAAPDVPGATAPADPRPPTRTPGAGVGLRQVGSARAGRRPGRRRCRDRLDRVDCVDHRGAWHPRDGGAGRHRLPRVPRRPGQDPAPEGPRRPAGRPAAGHPPRAARRRSGSPLSSSSSSTSTPSRPRSRPGRTRTRASSRSTSAARRWSAPRRRTTPTSPSSSRPLATPRCSRRCRPAGSPSRSAGRLAVDAFVHTATYDVAVASWMGSTVAPSDDGTGFPAWIGAAWNRGSVLRYGENPHQRAALYVDAHHHRPGLATARQLHGKEMSYNNYVDADAARRAAFDHTAPAVAIIKHANPCGIAVGDDILEAYARAFDTDPVSAFGGRGRGQPPGVAGDGRGDGRRVHRGRRRAWLRGRRARRAHREEERAAAGVPGPSPGAPRRDALGQRRPAAAVGRRRRGRRRRPRRVAARRG